MQQETSKEGSGQAPLLRTSSHWRTVRNVRNKLLSTGKKLSKACSDYATNESDGRSRFIPEN